MGLRLCLLGDGFNQLHPPYLAVGSALTTICYRDGIVAYDSRCVDEDGVIVSDNYNKRHTLDGIEYFLSGSVCDLPKFHNWLTTGEDATGDSDLFVVRDGVLLWGEIRGGGCSIDPPDEGETYWAIGSGAYFALTAMDLGLSAKEAVKMAAKRDTGTNSKVRTFKIKGK